MKYLGFIFLFLTSCQKRGILDPRGSVARQEELIIFNSAEVMAAIGIPTILLALFAAFWFRKGNKKANYTPEWIFSGRLELLTWTISGIAILILSSFAWIGSIQLDPGKPLESENEAIEIDVVSMRWKWMFLYKEEEIATINELVIPVDTPIIFRIASEDLMTSFFIPQLGSQIYAMSGMANRLYLEADVIGEYAGFAAHYNGEGFSDMTFTTRAVSEEDYQEYIQKTKKETATLDQNQYDVLRQNIAKEEPHTYGSYDENLFMQIMMQNVPRTHPAHKEKF